MTRTTHIIRSIIVGVALALSFWAGYSHAANKKPLVWSSTNQPQQLQGSDTLWNGTSAYLVPPVPLSDLAQIGADDLLGNPTGGTADVAAVPLLSCSATTSALTYNTTTHTFGCNSISGGGGGGPPYCALAGGAGCTMTGDVVINPGPVSAQAGGYMGAPPINPAHTTSYTLQLTDAGGSVVMNCASACTLTIPTHASVAFPLGTVIPIESTGAGAVTISRAGGVNLYPNGSTFNASITAGQHSTVPIYQPDTTDTWLASSIAAGPQLIQTVTTAASAASITFSSIPSYYSHLRILLNGNGSADALSANIEFNGDTGSHYYDNFYLSYGASSASTAGTNNTLSGPGGRIFSVGTGGLSSVIDIPNYTTAIFPISAVAESADYDARSGIGLINDRSVVMWKPSALAAVTSITIVMPSGNFVNGTTASLYGIP